MVRVSWKLLYFCTFKGDSWEWVLAENKVYLFVSIYDCCILVGAMHMRDELEEWMWIVRHLFKGKIEIACHKYWAIMVSFFEF